MLAEINAARTIITVTNIESYHEQHSYYVDASEFRTDGRTMNIYRARDNDQHPALAWLSFRDKVGDSIFLWNDPTGIDSGVTIPLKCK
jgi:hypothetical protein